MSVPTDLEEFVVRPSSPPHCCPRSPSTSVSRPRSESPPPSRSSYSRSSSPKRPRTTRSPCSESRDTSSPRPRVKPRAPKHSKQADADDKVHTCDAMFRVPRFYMRMAMFTYNFPCSCGSLFPILFKMQRKKGKEIDISLTDEEWEEVFQWLDTQPVSAKGVPYVSAARRFLPHFHIAEYKAGCSRWLIFQRAFGSKAQVRYQFC